MDKNEYSAGQIQENDPIIGIYNLVALHFHNDIFFHLFNSILISLTRFTGHFVTFGS